MELTEMTNADLARLYAFLMYHRTVMADTTYLDTVTAEMKRRGLSLNEPN